MPVVDGADGVAAAARATLDEAAIADWLELAAVTPSPTGAEEPLARALVEVLAGLGVPADVQPIPGGGANVVARLGPASGAPVVLVYSALDAPFAGESTEDEPFLGPTPRADWAMAPLRDGNRVIGMAAENPKGFAIAGLAAFAALARAGAAARLERPLVLVLAGGSMPVLARPGVARIPAGHGSGIRAALDALPESPAAAIVLKPGDAVVAEEVGVAWIRLTVRGSVGYTGIRHKAPYRNPILAAAALVPALEAWFAAYTARHATAAIAPQGSINAIRAGSEDRAAFVPATCRLDIDLRIAPGDTPESAFAELEAELARLRAADEALDVEAALVVAVPPNRSDPAHPVARALIEAWEARESRPHQVPARASGASDAGIIAARGIPTFRIGLPAAPPLDPNPYPGFSMGVVHAGSVRRLAETLVTALLAVAGGPAADAPA